MISLRKIRDSANASASPQTMGHEKSAIVGRTERRVTATHGGIDATTSDKLCAGACANPSEFEYGIVTLRGGTPRHAFLVHLRVTLAPDWRNARLDQFNLRSCPAAQCERLRQLAGA